MPNVAEILKLAQAQDIQKLKNLLSKKVCIDEYIVVRRTKVVNNKTVTSRILLTAAAILAANGKHDASNFLKSEFSANIDWIAFGAALGGYFDYAEKLLFAEANINYIAEGAACGGYHQYALKLYNFKGADLRRIVRGAACGGYRNFAESLLINQPPDKFEELINWMAHGAACGGHPDHALFLYNNRRADVSWVAAGAAQAGNFKLANLLIVKGAHKSYVASKAAAAGHYDYAEQLGQIESTMYGAILGGHFAYAEKILAKTRDFGSIIRAAVKGRHFSYLEHLYLRQEIKNTSLAVDTPISRSKTQLLLVLANAKTKEFRETYLYQLREKYETIPGYTHLEDAEFLKSVSDMNHLMTTYHLNFDQAYILYQEKSHLNRFFILEERLPDQIVIEIMSYCFNLDAFMLAILYCNFKAHRDIEACDKYYHAKLGWLSFNSYYKSEFSNAVRKIVTSQPNHQRPHFWKLCANAGTTNYHDIFSGDSQTKTYKKFQAEADAETMKYQL